MGKYRVTLHMDNGDILYPDDMFAENEVSLLNYILMTSDNDTPISNKFGRQISGDHEICYCIGKISSIHYMKI